MVKLILKAALLLLLAILVAGISTAFAEINTPAIIVDSIPMAPTSPLLMDNGSTLISIDDLSTILNANLNWNKPKESVFIQKHGRTILFKITENEILKNSKPYMTSVKPRFMGNVFYVPLRAIAEGLGAIIHWDDKAYQVEITTGDLVSPPKVVAQEPFNAVLAYTDNGHLWLLDGRYENPKPKMITDQGYAEIIGWSYDGSWLAYKYSANNQSEISFLWVVSADGKQNKALDVMPVYDNYSWSPTENKIIYTVYNSTDNGFISVGHIKCADITEDEVITATLMEDRNIVIPSITWYPDGSSVTVSIPRGIDKPPMLETIGLDKTRKTLYIYEDKEPIDPEGIYAWAFTNLKWSLDGRYIAYHIGVNSGSISADSVETAVLDTNNMHLIKLEAGLNYSNWMGFSPDSNKFAYIKGPGRDAQSNKKLELVNLSDGTVENPTKENYVASEFAWALGERDGLFYCSGKENKIIIDNEALPSVLVPRQRIYKLNGEEAAAITKGPDDTTDYYPNPSPDGKQMIFLRLNRFDQGSVYIQPPLGSQNAKEVVRGIRGSSGYYGNYYPKWMKVYWFN